MKRDKPKMNHLQALRLQRMIAQAFRANDYRIAGDIDQVANTLRRRGIRIIEYMGREPETIIREAENEWLRKKLRDYSDTIAGVHQRTYRHDGEAWLHLQGRLHWLTREPDEPDAKIRRAEAIEEVNSVIRQVNPALRTLRAVKKGLEAVIVRLKSGGVFEQPRLLDQDDSGAA